MTPPIRVVMVDDHAVVREALAQLLEAEGDIEVIGQAGDAATALALVNQEKPDCLLLDVQIPGSEVTETVVQVRLLSPATRVLILSMYDGPRLVSALLGLGVRGYLLKSVSRAELVGAVRAVMEDPHRVVLQVSAHGLGLRDTPGPQVSLSPQERRVLMMTSQAMSNAQIGHRLNLREATIKRHLHNAFTKLGAVSRMDAVNKAVAAGLIPPSGQPGDRLSTDRPAG